MKTAAIKLGELYRLRVSEKDLPSTRQPGRTGRFVPMLPLGGGLVAGAVEYNPAARLTTPHGHRTFWTFDHVRSSQVAQSEADALAKKAAREAEAAEQKAKAEAEHDQLVAKFRNELGQHERIIGDAFGSYDSSGLTLRPNPDWRNTDEPYVPSITVQGESTVMAALVVAAHTNLGELVEDWHRDIGPDGARTAFRMASGLPVEFPHGDRGYPRRLELRGAEQIEAFSRAVLTAPVPLVEALTATRHEEVES